MKKPKIKIAKGFMKWYLEFFNAFAAYAPWGTIYFRNSKVMKGQIGKKLVLHELKHLEQKEKDGLILYGIKYVYWLLIKGYVMNPYEIEARKAMGLRNKKEYYDFRKKYENLKK